MVIFHSYVTVYQRVDDGEIIQLLGMFFGILLHGLRVIELIEHDGNNKHCGSMSLTGIWRYIGRVMGIYTGNIQPTI